MVKNVLPVAKPAGWKLLAAVAVLLLCPIALSVTEFAGVTHLFRRQATPDSSKTGGEPTFDEVEKKETPDGVEKKDSPGGVGKKETPVPEGGPWTLLKPSETRSEGGATLELQGDGSILVSGELPAKDSYTLTFRNLPRKMQALRLEVLPHSSLPNNGPGRHSSGEYVLTTIRARLEHPRDPGKVRICPQWARNAWADNIRGEDSDVMYAIDEDDDTGWVTDVGQSHFAVFELPEPVTVSEGMVLRVTLEFKWVREERQLGCFPAYRRRPDAKAVKVEAPTPVDRP